MLRSIGSSFAVTVPSAAPPERAAVPADECEFLRSTLDSLSADVAVLDEAGRILYANAGWRRYAARISRPAQVGDDWLAACEAADADVYAAQAAAGVRAILAGQRTDFELEHPSHIAGEDRWLVLRATRHRGARPDRVILQHVDVTARRRATEEASLRSTLLDVAGAAVVAVDLDGVVTAWSQGAHRLYGWTQDEVVGRSLIELDLGDGAREQLRHIMRDIAETGDRESRFDIRRKDGSTVPILVRDAAMYAPDGELAGVVGVAVDLTEIADAERQLRAARDFSRAVTDSMGEGVCALDEDGRLVYMNAAAEEMLGWSLVEIAGEPMHDLIHSHHADGTPRPEGDCPILSTRHTGETLRAEDVFLRRDGTTFPVAYTAAPFETADGFRGSAYVFSDITEHKADRERLEHELESLSWIPKIRDALDEERFVVHAQPIIDLATGQTVQHELLIRMHDAEGGLVPPGLFLPVAEEHGLIADIDRWVIREAFALAGRGHAIELNVSAESLAQPGLLEYVEGELRRAGADPGLIVFELTETALLRSEQTAKAFIDGIAQLGCKLALDDFGTGYGGFTYLKRFPVDYLKIDIEFVRDLPRDEASQHVVHAVVNLARGFGQQTVAEGVEDAETLALLKDFGVDYAQGYFLGRPAPLAETIEAEGSAL